MSAARAAIRAAAHGCLRPPLEPVNSVCPVAVSVTVLALPMFAPFFA
jgi:hypothetical protein